MGGRYCAINTPRGSRWWSRVFGPHRGPGGDLLRNTNGPCRFAFIPNFICVINCILLKSDSSWIEQKNTLSRRQRPLNKICRYGDATTFTCDVIMVPKIFCEARRASHCHSSQNLFIKINLLRVISRETLWFNLKTSFVKITYDVFKLIQFVSKLYQNLKMNLETHSSK